MLNWTERKQKFLSDWFVNGKLNTEILNPIRISDTEENAENNENINTKISSNWAELLSLSKTIDPSISSDSLDTFSSGFKVSDPLGQKIFDIAFSRVLEQLTYETDYDQDIIKFNIIEYILINNLHKKSFQNLIKKLKNLTPDLLPYDF